MDNLRMLVRNMRKLREAGHLFHCTRCRQYTDVRLYGHGCRFCEPTNRDVAGKGKE